MLFMLYKRVLSYFFKRNEDRNNYYQIRWENEDTGDEYLITSLLKKGVEVQVKNRSKGTRDRKYFAYQRLTALKTEIYVLNYYHFLTICTHGLFYGFVSDLFGYKKLLCRWKHRKQFDFNAKPLLKKDRHMILKAIVEKQLVEPRARFHRLNVMPLLEGGMWLHHPNKDRDIAFIKLCLESWADTGELTLEKDNCWFKVGPKAVETIERMEREELVHNDNVKQANHIKYLTVCLVLVGIVQAIATAYQAYNTP
ncbi:hypothetical protein [Vibrio sp. ED002]|uniref:hypothetical protein n=1 Tax=Vibrio sp. ED002 TaxID=2785123 RepID=UPI00200E720B|nr:hypothetical protein [Vibrio sp. ED002]UQA50992.1 hypothetical protein ITG12_01240 [Vibrio sp. ED002]